MSLIEFISLGFFTGFVGSFHCIGMCGPIALALPGSRKEGMRFIWGRVFYNFGRILTYVSLGVLFGLLGERLMLYGLQQIVSVVAGAAIIFFVVSVYFMKKNYFRNLSSYPVKLKMYFGKFIQRKSQSGLFFTGTLNGLLPCGFVYIAIGAAIATGSVTGSSALMLGFGFGTIPVMLSISVLGKSFPAKVRQRFLKIAPAMILIVGVLLVLRGMNLGIPFVSPELKSIEKSSELICPL